MTRGESNNHSKLTEEIVIQLRKDYFQNGYTFLALSYKYKHNKQTIRNAVRGISWSHVKDYLDMNQKGPKSKRYVPIRQ